MAENMTERGLWSETMGLWENSQFVISDKKVL